MKLNQPFDKWKKDDGYSKVYSKNYDLNENSVVLDLGFYKGQFSNFIYNFYKSNIYAYEGVPSVYEKYKKNIINNEKINLFNYGLSNRNYETKISFNEDASSIYQINDKNFEIIKLFDFKDEVLKLNIKNIDLIKINIEGGEYDLFDSIFKNNLIDMINVISVQFHAYTELDIQKRGHIQSKLKDSHNLLFNYEWIWEAWIKK